MCKRVKLTQSDLEYMTVGNCLDYIDEYIKQINPDKNKVRKATQDDFDNF